MTFFGTNILSPQNYLKFHKLIKMPITTHRIKMPITTHRIGIQVARMESPFGFGGFFPQNFRKLHYRKLRYENINFHGIYLRFFILFLKFPTQVSMLILFSYFICQNYQILF